MVNQMLDRDDGPAAVLAVLVQGGKLAHWPVMCRLNRGSGVDSRINCSASVSRLRSIWGMGVRVRTMRRNLPLSYSSNLFSSPLARGAAAKEIQQR